VLLPEQRFTGAELVGRRRFRGSRSARAEQAVDTVLRVRFPTFDQGEAFRQG